MFHQSARASTRPRAPRSAASLDTGCWRERTTSGRRAYDALVQGIEIRAGAGLRGGGCQCRRIVTAACTMLGKGLGVRRGSLDDGDERLQVVRIVGSRGRRSLYVPPVVAHPLGACREPPADAGDRRQLAYGVEPGGNRGIELGYLSREAPECRPNEPPVLVLRQLPYKVRRCVDQYRRNPVLEDPATRTALESC
jgi:hypothetical protein